MENTSEKQTHSELEQLLEKNAYGEGLSTQEFGRALDLIGDPAYATDACWLCAMRYPSGETPGTHILPEPIPLRERAIYDTGLCSGHARYALVTQK